MFVTNTVADHELNYMVKRVAAFHSCYDGGGSLERKEVISMTQQLIEEVSSVLGGFALGSHVGVTELQRTAAWRDKLNQMKMLEILDRHETFAVMMKPELFDALRTYVSALEEQVEQLQLDRLFAHRAHANWQSGEELQASVLSSFEKRRDEFRDILHGDDQ